MYLNLNTELLNSKNRENAFFKTNRSEIGASNANTPHAHFFTL